MLINISWIRWVVIVVIIALAMTACGGRDAGQDIEPVSAIEAQSAPEETMPPAEPTSSSPPTDIPTPQPTPTDLPTELTELVSPLREPTMTSTSSEAQPLPDSEKALAAAIADLSEQTGLPPDQIQLVSMETVEWSDASLGCPQEGYMYAQVITPGFLIILEAQGQQYEYHTDRASNVVLCES
jgi:hypothetical protein